jgi:rhamnosyltransferase
MKICMGLTLFYPTLSELDSILKYSQVFERIYVFDNTDNKEEQEFNDNHLINIENIVYISETNNYGLSISLNRMCKKAIFDNFDFICLFDQDSNMNNGDLIKINNYIENSVSSDIGIYAARVVYGERQKEINLNNKLSELEVEWAITSGSYINLHIYSATNGFDENYFIDRLDYDYCFQLKKLNFKIVEFKNVFLYQQLGEKGRFLWFKISEHNTLRHYYIFRNRLYFYLNKYFSIKNIFIVFILSVNHFMIILIEKDSVKKAKIIKKSINDYLKNKMGKYEI